MDHSLNFPLDFNKCRPCFQAGVGSFVSVSGSGMKTGGSEPVTFGHCFQAKGSKMAQHYVGA